MLTDKKSTAEKEPSSKKKAKNAGPRVFMGCKGLRENEKNACDAFIEILQQIKGVKYFLESSPEKINNRDVDAILAPKDKNSTAPRIAVEHTIVEAYNSQIAYVRHLCNIVGKINQRCKGTLPPDRCFWLILPPELVRGNRRDIAQIIDEISDWIPNVARNLYDRQTSTILYREHKISLQCNGSVLEFNGTVQTTQTTPKNLIDEKLLRLHRAIQDKLPKLLKYKDKQGYATALLLEDVSYTHFNMNEHWSKLIPDKYHLDFQTKIDYVIILVSMQDRMIMGKVWKEKSQLHSDDQIFHFHQKKIS